MYSHVKAVSVWVGGKEGVSQIVCELIIEILSKFYLF